MSPPVPPPSLTERVLAAAVRSSPYADDIVGDLRESLTAQRSTHSIVYARWWYRVQAWRLIARYALRGRPLTSKRGLVMDRLLMDVRLAARSLVKRPLMTMTIVATLALGIGANAAVFGVIDALVLHPYTMRDVDRIVMPVQMEPNDTDRTESVSPANFLDWRRDIAKAGTDSAVQDLAAFAWWPANLMGRDEPEHAMGFRVSAPFFAALGVAPALGRTFVADDEIVGRDHKVVLSDGLWRRRFGADPAIIGQAVLVDGVLSEVVGVMPPGFRFPYDTEIWSPLSFDLATPPRRSGGSLTVVARLAPGRTIADAQAEMSVIDARLRKDFPRENKDRDIKVYSLAVGMRDFGLERILSLWQAAALFVLLIACANIANLLLARGAERSREIAVRLALGSSRRRIVRESMLESVVLALCAVPFSLVFASGFLNVMRGFMPARILKFVTGWSDMGVDVRVAGVALLLGVVSAMACGILPALQLSRGEVAETLKGDGRSGATPARQRLRRALVVAEIALVMPLLVSALMSIRSVSTFLAGWQGYEPKGLLVFEAALPSARYPDAGDQRRFVQSALQGLSSMPAVSSVAVTNALPSSGSNRSRRIEIEGRQLPPSGEWPLVADRSVNAAYFDTMRVPIRAGRPFAETDRENSQPVAVISESMAKKFWPEGGALGSRLRIGKSPWMIVVGICGDIIDNWFDRSNQPMMYRPFPQAPGDGLMFAVRTPGDPLTLAAGIRRAIAAVDPTQPLFDIEPMSQRVSERTIGLQFVAGVMGTFAAVAVILAILGLYAVMSYLVSQRVREIGVRLALGATTSDVTRLALWQAARLTAVGLAIGVSVAFALSRVMEAALLGVVHTDLATSLALAAALGVTGLAASYIPARRAASVDPMVALRNE